MALAGTMKSSPVKDEIPQSGARGEIFFRETVVGISYLL
jgi:hypothetical protein